MTLLQFDLLVVSTVKCNDSVSFSFFFVKDQLASFKLKQTVVFLKCVH